MPFPPNYKHQRNERTRAKDAKKQEKQRKREEASAQRKSLREGQTPAEPEPGSVEPKN